MNAKLTSVRKLNQLCTNTDYDAAPTYAHIAGVASIICKVIEIFITLVNLGFEPKDFN